MPSKDDVITLPALRAVFSGKRLAGSKVGGAQILRDFPRFVRLAETGQPRPRRRWCRSASRSTRSTTASTSLDRAEGVRTVIAPS